MKEITKTNTDNSGIEIIGLIKSSFKLTTWKIIEFTNAWIRYIPNVLFETLTIIFWLLSDKETFEKPEAKVNLSATNEMNPYLLLMAHAFIRNTIFIDSNGIAEAA